MQTMSILQKPLKIPKRNVLRNTLSLSSAFELQRSWRIVQSNQLLEESEFGQPKKTDKENLERHTHTHAYYDLYRRPSCPSHKYITVGQMCFRKHSQKEQRKYHSHQFTLTKKNSNVVFGYAQYFGISLIHLVRHL